MDIFTHLMFGYLLSCWTSGNFYNTYVVFGSLLAILPDFDIFLFPLSKRFPALGHHGATHTLLFVFGASTALFAGFSAYTGFSFTDPKLLVLMYACGASHILADSLTTWGVAPFYPFSKRYYQAELDTAVNPIPMLYFFAAISLFQMVKTNSISAINMLDASIIIAVVYAIYFGARAAFKLYFKLSSNYREFSSIPTIMPHRWKFAKREEDGAAITITVKTQGRPGSLCGKDAEQRYVIPKKRPAQLEKPEDLAAYTFWHPQVQMFVGPFGFPYFEIKRAQTRNGAAVHSDTKDGADISPIPLHDAIAKEYEIIWHAVEMPHRMKVFIRIDGNSILVNRSFRGN